MQWRVRALRITRINPDLVDVALAACLIALTLRMAYLEPGARRPFDGLGLALTVVAQASVALRRRQPAPAFAAAILAAATASLLGYGPGLTSLGPQITFATVARTGSWRYAGVCALALAGFLNEENLRTWSNPHIDTVFQTTAWVVILWTGGYGFRQLGLRNQRLAELTAELARRCQGDARRALVTERQRIARELHDIVSHHISVIAVQAELGSRLLRVEPEAAGGSLTAIADAGREALVEMRYMLSALRPESDACADGSIMTELSAESGTDSESGDPSPGLNRVPRLVERVRAAGVPVFTTIVGRERPLRPAVDLCAYRMIQESLTNVVKHAAPAVTTLTIEYTDAAVTIRVRNDGPALRTKSAEANGAGSNGAGRGGRGLRGMAERARILGGTLVAGPLPDEGFEVTMTVPTGPDRSPAARPFPAPIEAIHP